MTNENPQYPQSGSGPKGGDGLFENTHDLIQLFSPDGILLDVNPSWRRVLERPDDDITQLSVFSVVHPRDHDGFRKTVADVLKGQSPRKIGITMVSQSNREIIAEGSVDLIGGHQGSKVLRCILHDITKRRKYDELKDEFVGTISHELRTPLTVVREGMAQIRDGLLGGVTPAQREVLDMVLQSIDRLGRIINDLLDVSKLESGQVHLKRTLCNMTGIAREILANFEGLASQKGIELRLEAASDVIEVYLDRDKFIQVLTNLVGNAIKFTSVGYVRISLRELEGFAECKVSDTGRGISGEDLSRVFEKFRQFGRAVGPGIGGTGLGLSICKKLIELHHGKISIDSYPLKGTSVTVLLPKYTSREIFREHIAQALNRCAEEGGTLSLIIFDIVDFETVKRTLGEGHVREIVAKIEKLMNDSLRRAADVAIRDTKALLILLPDTKKENAFIVLGRLYQLLEEFLARISPDSGIEIHSSVATFPEDARTVDDILNRIYD